MIEEFKSTHIMPDHHGSNQDGRYDESNAHRVGQKMIDNHRVTMNEDGLIVPKKLYNPCLESREVKDLNKEIRWNAKA